VNSYTYFNQSHPAVANGAAGNFVVAWDTLGSTGTDELDSFNRSVQARPYDDAGTPLGGEFQVNTYTPHLQWYPAVASDAVGNFVVVWSSGDGSGGTDYFYSIQAQRYDANGMALGGEFQVNTYTTGLQVQAAVASDAAGNFVVVWASGGSTGTDQSYFSVQGRRYDATGTPLGTEFQVNTYSTRYQSAPSVMVDGAGNVTVVWESEGSAGTDSVSYSVQGQRYDANGMALGGEFQVNTYTTGAQASPAVASDAAGNFVVVWTSFGSTGTDRSGYSVQGQRYDISGTPVGTEFQVNTYTTNHQIEPHVAANGVGGFFVAWSSEGSAGTDTSSNSVQARVFVLGSSTSSSSSTSTSSAVTSSTSTTSTLPATDLLPGRSAIIRSRTLVQFVAKPVTADTFALPTADPVTVGGSLRVFDLGTTAGDDTYALPEGAPPLGWKGLGTPAGSKGYRYRGAGTPNDPCRVVLVRETIIKGTCRGTGVTLTPPFTGDVGIILSLGTTDRYCAQFDDSDEVRNDATLTKRKSAPAPGACP
jgi:hypothetical protein